MLTREENINLVKERISELELNGKIVIAFDFDELVVPSHLTRDLMKLVAKPIEKDKLEMLGSCSFDGLNYLQSLLIGVEWETYKSSRNNLLDSTPWREGFKELIEYFGKEFSMIFISSGIRDVCVKKLAEIGIKKSNIFGSEFDVENGRIVDSRLVISAKLKGLIVDNLRKNYKVISVGHSLGDRYMLGNSDLSISFNSNDLSLAQKNVKTPEEILEIVKTFSESEL